jgi:hypothetical protein
MQQQWERINLKFRDVLDILKRHKIEITGL